MFFTALMKRFTEYISVLFSNERRRCLCPGIGEYSSLIIINRINDIQFVNSYFNVKSD